MFRHFSRSRNVLMPAMLVAAAASWLVQAQSQHVTAPVGPPPAQQPFVVKGADDEELRKAYDRAFSFAATVKGKVQRASVKPHWFQNNTRFWYKNDLGGAAKEFIVVDVQRGQKQAAFDHQKLADMLSKAAASVYTADKLPFDAITFVDDGKAMEFAVAGARWKCLLATYDCAKIAGAKDTPKKDPPKEDKKIDSPDDEDADLEEPEYVQPQKKGQPPQPKGDKPVASPDGQWTVVVKNHDFYLHSKETGRESRITFDGEANNTYGLPRWAPNSKVFLAVRSIPAESLKEHLLDSAPKGQMRPKLTEFPYRMTGDKLDSQELWIFSVDNKKPIKVDSERLEFGVPFGQWKKDGSRYWFKRTDRGHQRVRLIEVDIATGKTRTIIDEKTDTRIVGAKAYTHHVDDGKEIIWASERDGWNHLYLIDTATGQVKNQITRGDWVVRKVDRVDDKNRQIWFSASGVHPNEDPYFLHPYRINFDGTGMTPLTSGNGNHVIDYSPDSKYLIDTYSRVDLAPVSVLRKADGSLVCELERADVSDLVKTGWRMPDVFAAKGRDGKTDIWGVVYKPSNYDPARKYPVIEYIYAGPQTATAPKVFTSFSSRHALAELGFIVVIIDGMGTPGRSKAFHDISHHNYGDAGLPDRILWIKALAKQLPCIDLTRVGIYGHSGGGYSSMRAMLTYPDFYKVAVSSSGNHEHRLYNFGYTEQWMGYPVGKHYEEQSNITNAHKLKGKLLLIHGEIDNNVLPVHTIRLVDALVKASKDFDLLILPGKQHGIESKYVDQRRYDFFVRHLLGVEPPNRNSGPAVKIGAK
jgi:dipeptidyl-peptidase-4